MVLHLTHLFVFYVIAAARCAIKSRQTAAPVQPVEPANPFCLLPISRAYHHVLHFMSGIQSLIHVCLVRMLSVYLAIQLTLLNALVATAPIIGLNIVVIWHAPMDTLSTEPTAVNAIHRALLVLQIPPHALYAIQDTN